MKFIKKYFTLPILIIALFSLFGPKADAAATFVKSATGTAVSGTSVAASFSSGNAAAGNLLVALVGSKGNVSSITGPSGFTQAISEISSTATNPSLSIFYKISTGGETSFSASVGTNNGSIGLVVLEYTGGVNTLDTFVSGTIGTGATVTANSIVASQTNQLILAGAAAFAGTAMPNASWGGSGFTVATSDKTTGGNASLYGVAHKTNPIAGTAYTASGQISNATDWRAQAASFKSAPPTLQSFSSANVSGTYGPGASINITANYNHNLGAPSTMTVVLNTGVSVTLSSVSGTTLTGTYVVGATGSGQNTSALNISSITSQSVRDTSGNIQTSTTMPGTNISPAKTITVDTTAPTLNPVTIASNNANPSYAKLGNTVTLSFTSGETINTPAVTFRSGGVLVTGPITVSNPSGNNWTASYVVASGDTDGLVTFTINFSDLAGNSGTQVTSTTNTSSVIVDKTAPSTPGTPDMTAASDTGISNIDNITSDTTPTFDISCETGATVKLYDGATEIASGTCVGGTVSLTSPILSSGVHSITATQTDPAGNVSSSSSALSVTIDTTAPTVTVNQKGSQADPTNVLPIEFDVVFSEAINASTFAAADITQNGTATGITWMITNSGNDINFVLSATAITGTGTVVPSIGVAKITDLAGNNNLASTSTDNQVTYTTANPTITNVTSSTADGNYKDGESISIQITFSEAVTVTGTPTLGLNSGGSASYSSGSGTDTLTFSYTISSGENSADLDYSASNSLSGGTIKDADTGLNNADLTLPAPGGSGSLGFNKNIVVDTTEPTLDSVSIASNNADPFYAKVGDTVTVSFTSSESIQSPTVLIGGVAASIAGGPTVWTASRSMTAEDEEDSVSFSIDFTDLAGNEGSQVNEATEISFVTFDKTVPTVLLSSSDPDPTNSSISVAVEFSEDVNGFAVIDINVTNGVAGNFVGDGNSYTFEVTPSANGLVTISVPAGTAQDAAGNLNTGSNEISRTYDNVNPSVNVTSSAAGATNDSPISMTVTFDKDVSGFDSGDIQVTNGTVANFAVVDAQTYTFDVTPSGEGEVTVLVLSGAATDDANNQNTESNQFSIIYDITAPNLLPVTPVSTPTPNQNPSYTFSSNEAGTITYGGSCSSATTVAVALPGTNTIILGDIFNGPLVDGEYADCTIIVTDAAGNSSSILLIAPFKIDTNLPVTQFTMDDFTSMTVGTRLPYSVVRRNSSNTAVFSGENVAYLYTTSPSGKFYDSEIGGNIIPSVTIPDGDSSASFWYYDETINAGTIITVSDKSTAPPDGVLGIDDAIDTVSVDINPASATKFIIFSIDPANPTTSSTVEVKIRAVSDSNVIDTTYNRTNNSLILKDLAGNSSVSGAGLSVNIVGGQGTINIADTTAETITLALQDNYATDEDEDTIPLDATDTQSVTFTAVPVPAPTPTPSGGGGGGTSAPAPAISFEGQAYPGGLLTVLAISLDNVPIEQEIITSADGKFDLNFQSNLTGIQQYGLFVLDPNGLVSQVKIYTLTDGVPNLNVSGLLMSPTVGLLRHTIGRGDFLSISGYATPESTVEFEVNGVLISEKATASLDGSYNLLWNTVSLDFGRHVLRVRQTTEDGITSEFSPTKNFDLKPYIITSTDLNADGTVDVRDASIFLSLWYGSPDNPARTQIDLNKDGNVDIQDLSIFLRTLEQ